MNHRYGVIDLGTNTFHLLIIEKIPDGKSEEIFRERVFVKLASEGIERIGDAPFQRGVETMIRFHKLLKKYEVQRIRAVGTAALRTASNGPDFVQLVAEKTGINIQLIDGNQEARFIYQGVRKAVPLDEENTLIMDIGGGSVEFIIANNSGMKWAQSFPVGVAVLYKKFHKSDPITTTEIQRINAFLNEVLLPLFEVLKKYSVHKLIGASGTFDVLELFLTEKNKSAHHATVPVPAYKRFSEKLVFTTVAERLALQRLPDSRADLIVVALVLIDFIIAKTGVDAIITSAYAMKEGILSEMT